MHFVTPWHFKCHRQENIRGKKECLYEANTKLYEGNWYVREIEGSVYCG
nr:MAG TPA: hypothetical protein [Caudoviricetes sp.]